MFVSLSQFLLYKCTSLCTDLTWSPMSISAACFSLLTCVSGVSSLGNCTSGCGIDGEVDAAACTGRASPSLHGLEPSENIKVIEWTHSHTALLEAASREKRHEYFIQYAVMNCDAFTFMSGQIAQHSQKGKGKCLRHVP